MGSSLACTESVTARLGAALAVIPEAALELDPDGVVLAANDLALDLFAAGPEDLVGCDVDRLVPLRHLLDAGGGPVRARLSALRMNGVPVLADACVRGLEVAGARRTVCTLRALDYGALAGEAQRHFDAAFDNAPIGMALFNCDGEYVRVNDALCQLLGRSREQLIGRRDQELTHPDDRQADVDAAWEILAGRLDTHQCEKRFLRPDGSLVWTLANLTFLRDEAGRPISWVGQFQDITARRAAEEALRASEQRFRLAFEHAPIGIALVGPDGRWLRVNRTLCEMTGYSESELLASRFQDITHPDELENDVEQLRRMLAGELRSYEVEKRYLRRDGSTIWVLLSVSLIRDPQGRPLHFVSQVQDIDERKRAHGRLEHLARHDALTGALNRHAWDDELECAIAEARCKREPLAVALIDLNGFKQVNDTHGHAAGDRVLQQAVQAWREQLRGSDRLARLGGDEFAVLLRGDGATHADAIGRRLKRTLPHSAGCAVGVATCLPDDSAATLLTRADAALYRDKSSTGRAAA